MTEDTPTTHRRVPLLLRRVTLPSWLQAILLIVVAYCLIDLLMTNPKLVVVGLIGAVIFTALIRNPLQRAAGEDPQKDAREIREAPSPDSALAVAWRQYRTYQVWHLALIAVGIVLVLLDLMGIPTP